MEVFLLTWQDNERVRNFKLVMLNATFQIVLAWQKFNRE